MSVHNCLGIDSFPIPVGAIMPFLGQYAPDTFLICDGSEVDATLYPQLYKLIGNSFGVASSANSFLLPNLSYSYPTYIVGASNSPNSYTPPSFTPKPFSLAYETMPSLPSSNFQLVNWGLYAEFNGNSQYYDDTNTFRTETITGVGTETVKADSSKVTTFSGTGNSVLYYQPVQVPIQLSNSSSTSVSLMGATFTPIIKACLTDTTPVPLVGGIPGEVYQTHNKLATRLNEF